MANLNFQQPPRNLASGSLSSRGVGAFGSNAISDHVASTTGMFPQVIDDLAGSTSFSQSQPPHMSPNRSLSMGVGPPSMSSRTLFNRAFSTDRRGMAALGNSNPMSGMGSFMAASRAYGSGAVGSGLGSLHSVFGGSGDNSTPPLLDLAEFPSLNRGQGDQSSLSSNSMQAPGTKPYVGMVKQPTNEQNEFQMSSEDFPALPGTHLRNATSPGGTTTVEKVSNTVMDLQQDIALSKALVGITEKTAGIKRGIQTSPDGKVTNIPGSMVCNQFGMVGLLTFIRAADTDPNLVSLALGQDLTGLGLNLNSSENLYSSFDGPWADCPCRPQDMDYPVPPEYLINMSIRDKLAVLKLTRYKDDLLFYMFYSNIGDLLQLAAAVELYNREWRYHMEEKVWITQAPGGCVVEKTSAYERGTYYYFDAQNWRKVAKEFHLDYSKLEGRPHIPSQL